MECFGGGVMWNVLVEVWCGMFWWRCGVSIIPVEVVLPEGACPSAFSISVSVLWVGMKHPPSGKNDVMMTSLY